MHPALLCRITNDVQIARIAARVPVVCGYRRGDIAPEWVAKYATSQKACGYLRREWNALEALSAYAGRLAIPTVIEWHDLGDNALLIQTGIRGEHFKSGLPTSADRTVVARRFDPPLRWVAEFRRCAAHSAHRTIGAIVEDYACTLQSLAQSNGRFRNLLRLLGPATPLRGELGSAVHGDFISQNLLYNGSTIGVYDWATFGDGLPIQDFFSFAVNQHYEQNGRWLSLSETYVHVFFSSSSVCQYLAEVDDVSCYRSAELRYLFYSFVASQICADTNVPITDWLKLIDFLDAAGWPEPFVSLR